MTVTVLMIVLLFKSPAYIWANPSQIGWSAYTYVTYHFEIKIFMFFSKKHLTRIFLIFLFNQNFIRSVMPKNSEKILT